MVCAPVGSWTRIGPVRTSAAADLLSGLAVAPLPILLALDALEIWQVVLLAAVGTLADSAGSTARQSLVPAAADRRRRTSASAPTRMFTSAEHVGYLLGAPIAGLLIAGLGVGGALWVTVARVRLRRARRRRGSFAFPHARRAPTGRQDGRPARGDGVHLGRPGASRAVRLPDAGGDCSSVRSYRSCSRCWRAQAFGDPVVLGVMVASYGAGGLLGAAGFGLFGSRISRRRLYAASSSCGRRTFAAITLVPSLPFTLVMLLTLGLPPGRSCRCRPRSARNARPRACCRASSG